MNGVLDNYTPIMYNRVFVNTLLDLPEPAVGGFITLQDNTLYEFAPGTLDLGTNKLVCPTNCILRGQGTFASLITSSITSGETFITSTNPGGTLHIEGLQFNFSDSNFVLFDCQNLEQLLVTSTFFIGEGAIGTFANIQTARFGALCSIVGFSSGLKLDGVLGSTIFDRVGFINIGGSPASPYIYTTSTCTIGILLDFAGCVGLFPTGTTGIYIDPATTFAFGVHKFSIKGCTFDGGGTMLDGITPDNPNLFARANLGIQDSRAYASYYVTVPSITNVVSVGVPVKANGETESRGERGFLQNDNQVTYNVPTPIQVHVRADAFITPTSAVTTAVSLYVVKNSSIDNFSKARVYLPAEGTFVSTDTIFDAVSGDYFEIWVANETDTNPITLESELTKLTLIAL